MISNCVTIDNNTKLRGAFKPCISNQIKVCNYHLKLKAMEKEKSDGTRNKESAAVFLHTPQV